MGTVNVLTAEKTLQLLNETIVSALVNESNELIFTKQDGTTINAGVVGNSVDTSGLRAQTNADIQLVAGDPESIVETTTINDDGSDTSTWANRLVYKFVPAGGSGHNTTYLNEYGEYRGIPAKTTTVAARWFTKSTNTDPSHDANTPIVELMDDPVTRTNLRGWLGDGGQIVHGIRMADVLVLGSTDPVPAGTPVGTVILRNSPAIPLNLNTGFEVDASHWTGAGGTFTRDTTVFKAGIASGKIVATGGIANVTISSDRVAVTAGNTYKTNGWLRCSATQAVYLNVNWYNSSNTYLSTSSASVSVTANTWASLSSTFVAPASATQASIAPTLSGTPAAGVTLWADDVMISA